MSEEQELPVYVDCLPTHANDPAFKDSLRDIHRQKLERDLDNIIARQGRLPPLMVHRTSEYVQLLVESRDLFCQGYFYSCVAMCGIVAERILKDVMRRHVYTVTRNGLSRPSDKAFDQLERVDIRSITQFLAEANLIDADVRKAAIDLGDLRNKYAHARGHNPESDALKAIEHMHKIVEGTVSVFRDFTIRDGRLVRKSAEVQERDAKNAT